MTDERGSLVRTYSMEVERLQAAEAEDRVTTQDACAAYGVAYKAVRTTILENIEVRFTLGGKKEKLSVPGSMNGLAMAGFFPAYITSHIAKAVEDIMKVRHPALYMVSSTALSQAYMRRSLDRKAQITNLHERIARLRGDSK